MTSSVALKTKPRTNVDSCACCRLSSPARSFINTATRMNSLTSENLYLSTHINNKQVQVGEVHLPADHLQGKFTIVHTENWRDEYLKYTHRFHTASYFVRPFKETEHEPELYHKLTAKEQDEWKRGRNQTYNTLSTLTTRLYNKVSQALAFWW